MRLSMRFSGGAKHMEFVSVTAGEERRGTATITIDGAVFTETPLSPPEWVGRTETEHYSIERDELWFIRESEVLVLKRRAA
jgi:hypothetical protein